MRIDLEELTQLRDIFQNLLRGYHISNEDFGLYHELQEYESSYDALFAALGYELRADRRGFYYLFADDAQATLNSTTQKMALLIFLLIEHLADNGRDPQAAITSAAHDVPELAACLAQKYPKYLKDGGFDNADAVEKYFPAVFRRLGFATITGNSMRFRPPILRFLDLCAELGQGRELTSSEGGERHE